MGVDRSELERLTRAYGDELFARVDAVGPTPFSAAWVDERMMDWTMADPAVKVQLFRFIDALPQIRDPEDVTRHLQEYFAEAKGAVPGWIGWLVRRLPRRGWGARAVASLAQRNAGRLARRFIAGSNLAETVAAVAKLRKRRLAFTVDLLGEAVVSEAEADRYLHAVLGLIDGLARELAPWPACPLIDAGADGPIPRVNVSVKLSSLFSQFDPIDPAGTTAAVQVRLRQVFRAARERGVFVNLDMEQSAYKDVTLRIFRETLDEPEFRDWPDVGIALQAYLRSGEADLRGLAEWAERRGTPIAIRLVKGAYWDYETVVAAQEGWPAPVFANKHETDALYEKLTLFLLEHRRILRPAFASHNIRSLAHAMAAAQLMGVPPGGYELQMLYGMADPIQNALVRLDQRVRIYTPYGEMLPGMAYLVRRLLENTANTSFLRARFTEHVPEERLLMNPALLADETPPAPTLDDGRFRNEPLVDFTLDASRTAMQEALAEVRRAFGQRFPSIVAGKALESQRWLPSVNPSHLREVVGSFGAATPAQASEAVAAAARAFPAWRDLWTERRCEILEAAADLMRRRRFRLSAWIVHECAKPWREPDADVAEAIDFCVYYAREARRLAQPQRFDLPGEENAYFHEPRGVTVVIAPWNFPLAILCGMSAAALVMGNPVVMKPAEQSSVVAAQLFDIFREAGVPPGAMHLILGVGEEVGPALVEHPETALVAFTGSRGVGQILARQTAELASGQTHFKRLVAELGGKNAVIVDDDADLDEAVSAVVAGAFGYQGQKCSACSRVILLAPIHDAFLARLVEATKSLKVGPAEDPGSRVGPVIDDEARQRILQYVELGKQESRSAYAGDLGFLTAEGFYVAPHVFADVPPTARIAQEEIFGPVLAVLKAKDLDEALAIANGTAYALTGGFHSRSPERIAKVKREFRVGNLYVNRKITGALVARQPFGGYKLSGVGSKAGGPDYLQQFAWPRNVTENTLRRGFAPTP